VEALGSRVFGLSQSLELLEFKNRGGICRGLRDILLKGPTSCAVPILDQIYRSNLRTSHVLQPLRLLDLQFMPLCSSFSYAPQGVNKQTS
jgi:hypothetical protein